MDKKIILVLLILLVLAIYYCYTHESFTENFKSVAEIVKGGVIEFFESSANNGNITGDLNVSGNTKLGGPLVFKNEVWNTSADGKNRMHFGNNSHTYFGTGEGYWWRDKNDKNISNIDTGGNLWLQGKITASSRDILAEIDALKTGNASKGGTDTNKAIEDLGKIAAQLLAGGATVPGNLTINGTTIFKSSLWNKSDDGQNRFWLDKNGGTYFGSANGYYFRGSDDKDILSLSAEGGLQYKSSIWNKSDDGQHRLWFDKNGGSYFSSAAGYHFRAPGNSSAVDNMILDKDGKLFVKGRDILAELDALKNDTVKIGQHLYIRSGTGLFQNVNILGSDIKWYLTN